MSFACLDYETFVIQPYMLAPPPVVFTLQVEGGKREIVHVRDSAFRRILLWLWECPTVKIVAHNLHFEAAVTMAYEPEWTSVVLQKYRDKKVYCTLMRDKLIEIGRGFTLGTLFDLASCCNRWRIPNTLDKQNYWRTRFGMLSNTPISLFPQEALDYALDDMAAWDLFKAQERVNPNLLVNQHDQFRYDLHLYLTSCWGFPTDEEWASKLFDETETRLIAFREELVRQGLVRIEFHKGQPKYIKNQNIARELCEHAYNAMGREPPRGELSEKMAAKGMTEGNISVSKESCRASKSPILYQYSAYSRSDSLLSKVKRFQFPLIQTSYDALKETGRTSSRQGDDPAPGEAYTQWGSNLQNMAKSGDPLDAAAAEDGED